MYLGKSFLVSIFVLIGFGAFAQTESIATPAPPEVATARPAAKTVRRVVRPAPRVRFELSAGYIQWNEKMDVTQGPMASRAYANYAGPALGFEFNRYWGRWLWDGSFFVAGGRAAAGGFGSIAFSDAIDRSWYGGLLEISSAYRVNPYFLAGLGLMGRVRIADWEPEDQSVKVEVSDTLTWAGSVKFRFILTRHWTLVQTITPLSFTEGTSQWLATLNYKF